MFYELQLGGDVFELGQADGVRFMGGQCLRLLVGDLSCGSVGTKVVERKVLKPASTLSPVCSDRWCITNFFPNSGNLWRVESWWGFNPSGPSSLASILWGLCLAGIESRLLGSSGSAWLCWDHVAGSQSWVRVGSFLSQCCRPGLEVFVAVRVEFTRLHPHLFWCLCPINRHLKTGITGEVTRAID